jgi:hypothetical protein
MLNGEYTGKIYNQLTLLFFMADKEFEYEKTAVKVKHFSLESISNSKFVKLVSAELPEARYAGLIMYSKFREGKPSKHISKMYESPYESRDSLLSIDCDDSEDLDKILQILKKS